MYIAPKPQEFTSGLYTNNCTKIGGVNKGNRIVTGRQRLESIENEFMAIAFKSNRAEDQREERRAKRR